MTGRKTYDRPDRRLHHPIRRIPHNRICAVQLAITLNVSKPHQQPQTCSRYTCERQYSPSEFQTQLTHESPCELIDSIF